MSLKHLFNQDSEKMACAVDLQFKNIWLDQEEIKEVDPLLFANTLIQHKLQVKVFDPLFNVSSINDDASLKHEIELYDTLFNRINPLQVSYVIYRLPFFDNVVEDYNRIEKHLKSLLNLIRKQKIILLVKPEDKLANTFTYILKKMNHKQLRLLFDAAYFQKKESLGTAYRQLAEVIDVMLLNDYNDRNEPEPIGFGQVKIEGLLKRVARDRLSLEYLINPAFNFYFSPQESYHFLQRIFDFDGNRKRKKLKHYAQKCLGDKNKNITISDVYEHEISKLKEAGLLL